MDLGRAEVVRFLSLRPPFDALSTEELSEMAAEIELEFHPSGTAILTEDGGPVTYLRVINAGAVSIVHDGRLLDVLSPGESFGHDAMLAGMAPGFEARAIEDTLCYRIPAEAAWPLLQRARTRERELSAGDPSVRAVVTLLRGPAVLCGPDESIGTVAREMTRAGTGAVIVELPGPHQVGSLAAGWVSHLGIVTDQDLRSRALGAGLGSEQPVSAIMTTPVFTVTPDRCGADVLVELLQRGIHHVPLMTAAGRVVGVIEERDLFGHRERAWFGLRRAIGRAADAAELARAGTGTTSILLDLHGAGVGSLESARVLSALTDALVVRALELTGEACDVDTSGLMWVALASHARRELTPASRPVGALVCAQHPPDIWRAALARTFTAAGLPSASAARSVEEWQRWGPDDRCAMAVLSDRRPLWGTPLGPPGPLAGARQAELVSRLASHAASAAIPTGFDDDAVLGSSGASRTSIDIHASAVRPIQALAAWAGAAAGEHGGSTPERLAAGARCGVLEPSDAVALTGAFGAAFDLRMSHQIEQLATGTVPDDTVMPAELSQSTRNEMRDVFRTISAVRRRLA